VCFYGPWGDPAASVWYLSGNYDTFRDMAIPNGSRRVPHLKLKELRVNAGMTPNDLAFKAGVTGKTVRLVELGFIPGPRVQFQIAGVFEMLPLDLWPFDRARQKVAA
jgi:DNA-binding XRE family transcriptional regulator